MEHQEHADRRGAEPAAGEDPLLGARRGRDQGARSPTTRRSARRKTQLMDQRRDRQPAAAGSDVRDARRRLQASPTRPRRRSCRLTQKRKRRGRADRRRCASAMRGGGCTGFTYVFEWADRAAPEPTTCSSSSTDGGTCACSSTEEPRLPRAARRSTSSRADGPRLQVREPERQGTCGCGESVQF